MKRVKRLHVYAVEIERDGRRTEVEFRRRGPGQFTGDAPGRSYEPGRASCDRLDRTFWQMKFLSVMPMTWPDGLIVRFQVAPWKDERPTDREAA